MRSCVGCRLVRPKAQLLRVVAKPQGRGWRADVRGRLSGRGAYLCLRKTCLEKAGSRRALERSLRAKGRSESLAAEIARECGERVEQIFAQAKDAGALRSGKDAVRTCLDTSSEPRQTEGTLVVFVGDAQGCDGDLRERVEESSAVELELGEDLGARCFARCEEAEEVFAVLDLRYAEAMEFALRGVTEFSEAA